ncbi:MAG: hypothetical protein TREMPRED_002678 [Tremellales sp. Tagirdzhanova-0007]|nr:MAG: hypothetical protein TREMPRED_002678 [Tremellales sp. Tagirdzhanova-0007]
MSSVQPAAAPSAGQPTILQKKGLLAGRGPKQSIVSPTDNVLSPCSAKLSGAKQRHFQNFTVMLAELVIRAKPMGLASQLSQLAASGSGSSIASNGDKPKVDF